MLLNDYKKKLGNVPTFLEDYLSVPSILRLKQIGYFCGMDYASKDIYHFKEKITRYDHSLTVALLVYFLTKDKKATIAGLFHDVSTPCFAHVIDYMNEDYAKQESTEQYTKEIMMKDKQLLNILKKDRIKADDISNFKKYTVVDNERPKLCADRLDGIILTSIGWSNNINKEQIIDILDHIELVQNEDKELEIGFTKEQTAKEVVRLSDEIDGLCHSKEDNYMMTLLGKITKKGIEEKLFTYDELFYLGEEELLERLSHTNNESTKQLLNLFYHIRKDQIKIVEIPNVKKRIMKPLIQKKRMQ